MTAISTLTVEDACAALGAERQDEVAVLTMSAIAYWPDPRPEDYRLMGLMGSAGAIGLGLALGLGERGVWVLDGDGSLLMQLGVLAAVAGSDAGNLVHFVLVNDIYAISGAQPTPGAVDFAALFEGAGYAAGLTCSTADELRAAIRRARTTDGPVGIAIRCAAERPAYPAGAFGIDPAEEAARVRRTLRA